MPFTLRGRFIGGANAGVIDALIGFDDRTAAEAPGLAYGGEVLTQAHDGRLAGGARRDRLGL